MDVYTVDLKYVLQITKQQCGSSHSDVECLKRLIKNAEFFKLREFDEKGGYYTRLDRFTDSEELRDAWDMHSKLEWRQGSCWYNAKGDGGRFTTKNAMHPNTTLVRYRVPTELVDMTTGLPNIIVKSIPTGNKLVGTICYLWNDTKTERVIDVVDYYTESVVGYATATNAPLTGYQSFRGAWYKNAEPVRADIIQKWLDKAKE